MSSDTGLLSGLFTVSAVLKFIALGAVAYPFVICIYNLYWHPLRSFPGPRLNAASVWPKISQLQKGRLQYHVTDLHARYGRVVRIAPDELSFTDPRAWRDIYARKGAGRFEIPQDQDFYNSSGVDKPSMLGCLREEHDELRKLMNNGFSDRAMKAQEPVIGGYVDKLVERLERESTNSKPKNLRDWIAWTTFDIIGRLTFGSDFGCLENSDYHPWVGLIMGNIKNLSTLYVLKRLRILPFATFLMRALKVGDKQRKVHIELTEAKTRQRVAEGTGHHDFLDGLIKSDFVDFEQLKRNTGLFVVAGSETTATLLTGCLFYITRRANAGVMEKLKAEVRGRFKTEDEITLTSVNTLSYMLAVLNETLRRYPPVAITAPRRVGPGGSDIAGYHVPENTVVGVWQYATYHDTNLFTDPYTFDPERFYDRSKMSKYVDDQLEAVKPFITGPRNCIGQNLAIAEMRLILARLIWRFDMVLDVKCEDWLEKQNNYLLWDKPDLFVHLTSVRR